MKRHLIWVLSASIVGSTCAYFVPTPQAFAADTPTTRPDAALMFPAGITVKDLHDQSGIQSALKNVTESALKYNGFDSVVYRLVDQDRKRMDEYKDRDFQQLNAVIAQIQKAWKDKYGKDFDITADQAYVPGTVSILQGEVADPDLLIGNWPVAATAATAGEAQTASAHDVNTAKNSLMGGDVKLEKGRDVALVRFDAINASNANHPGNMADIGNATGRNGMESITASMIHELPDVWRFDIPNNITGQNLRDNLTAQMTFVNQHSAQWPADINQAYAMVSRHVLMALYGVPATSSMTDIMH